MYRVAKDSRIGHALVSASRSAVRPSGPQRHGFTISSTEVVFRGTCPTCKRKEVNA